MWLPQLGSISLVKSDHFHIVFHDCAHLYMITKRSPLPEVYDTLFTINIENKKRQSTVACCVAIVDINFISSYA